MLWQSNTRSPLTFALSAVVLKAGGKILIFSVYPRRCFFAFSFKNLQLNSHCEELES